MVYNSTINICECKSGKSCLNEGSWGGYVGLGIIGVIAVVGIAISVIVKRKAKQAQMMKLNPLNTVPIISDDDWKVYNYRGTEKI